MTNSEYANSHHFRKLVEDQIRTVDEDLAGFKVDEMVDKICTKRQASKFRRGKGRVYKHLVN